MTESNPENQQQDLQDPAEPKRVDVAVETEAQPAEPTEDSRPDESQASPETEVRVTDTETQVSVENDHSNG